MTRETYRKMHSCSYKGKHERDLFSETDCNYVPKHTKKLYYVWRVLSPIGPQETISVYGIDEVEEKILGCWDYEVKTSDGKVIEL